MDGLMSEFRTLMVFFVVVLPLLLVGCSISLDSEGRDAPTYRGTDPLANGSGSESAAPPDDADTDDDDDQAGDGDDDLAGGSGDKAQVISTDPVPGSSDHHYRQPIVVTFDAAGSNALFQLEGPAEDGAHHVLSLLPIEWNAEGTVASVYPAEFLAPTTEYSVSIEQNDSMLEYSFSTTSLGAPLQPSVQLDGLTYSILPSEATVVEPAGLAPLLATMSADFSWLWQFHSDIGQSEMSIDTGAGAVDGGLLLQDACTPTAPLLPQDSGLTLDDAYFWALADSATFWLGGSLLELENVEVDGDFRDDASSIEEVQLSGWLHSAGLASLVSLDSSSTSAASLPCDWLQQRLGVSCQTCPSGSGDCIWVEFTSLSGMLQAQTLQQVESAGAGPCDGDDSLSAALSCTLASARATPGLVWLLLPAGLLLRRRRSRS